MSNLFPFLLGSVKYIPYLCIEHIKQYNIMEVLSTKNYNIQQTKKWERDYEKAKLDGRHFSMMPQLAFYLFNPSRNYGYVAFNDNKALWDKTKKGVIEYWEVEQNKKKMRGW